MNSSLRRFDVVVLRKLAGEKVFARGEAYHLKGHVQILSMDNRRVRAQVAGTEDYRTEVTGRDFEIDGSCSCPAFDDTGLCKHMVIELPVFASPSIAGVTLHDTDVISGVYRERRIEAQDKHLPTSRRRCAENEGAREARPARLPWTRQSRRALLWNAWVAANNDQMILHACSGSCRRRSAP